MDAQQFMRFAGAKQCTQERTPIGHRIVDEAGRVLLEVNLITGTYAIIPVPPATLFDYADRGWDEE